MITRPVRATASRYPQVDVVVGGLRLRALDLPARSPEAAALPPLLLVHGHVSRLEEYDDLLPHLAGGRRILVPDMPGSGYSDKPDVRYDLAYLEHALAGFLDAAGATVVDVGGGSLGGNLALRLAHRYPDRVRRVAAWSPAGVWSRMYHWAAFGATMKHVPSMFWPSLWVQSRFWYGREHPDREALLARAFHYFREVDSPAFRRAYWEVGVDQAWRSLFDIAPAIRQPVYLAYGADDHALGINRGTPRLAGLLAAATLERFDGAGHALANEHPARLADAIRGFLG